MLNTLSEIARTFPENGEAGCIPHLQNTGCFLLLAAGSSCSNLTASSLEQPGTAGCPFS